MKNPRIAITLLSSLIPFGVHTSAQAQPSLATGAPNADAAPAGAQAEVAGAEQISGTITAEALRQAIADGTLEGVIAEALGENPGLDQIAALQSALDNLAVNAPTDAAIAAQAVVAIARVLAVDSPQVAIDVVRSAVRALTYPAVADAVPDVVGQSLAEVVGVVTLAERSGESQGLTLTGTEVAQQVVDFAQTNDAVSAAVPDFDQRVAEAVELANVQADLADVAPADEGDQTADEAGVGDDTGLGDAAELVSTLTTAVDEGGGGGGSIISPAAP